tara:strand:- start:273 stop:518 length:246 start_codon:yes stop_codon:yes gene_type:complete
MVVLQLGTIDASLLKEYHMTTTTLEESECRRLRCVLTVRHVLGSAGSVVVFQAVLLQTDSVIGQDYIQVSHGGSMKIKPSL